PPPDTPPLSLPDALPISVGLVPDVPHDPVDGRVVEVVQRDRQLHGPEARGQVAAGDRAYAHDLAAQLLRDAAELVLRQALEVGGRPDAGQQRVRRASGAHLCAAPGSGTFAATRRWPVLSRTSPT